MPGSGNPESQLRQIRERIKTSPNDRHLHFQEGLLCVQLGEIASAISAFSRAIQLNPDEPTAYVNRAHAHLQRSDYRHAIEDFSTALRSNPADALTLNDRASARQRAGDFDLALQDFQSANASRPDLLAPRIGEGSVLLARNEYAAAIAVYTHALGVDDASAVYWYRGRASMAAERWAEALRDFEVIQRRGEGSHYLANDRGICLRKLGRLREAVDAFSEIVHVRPTDTEALGQRAWTLFRLGELERAKADFGQCLQIQPGDSHALFSLSLVYWQAGELQTALDYMNQAGAAGEPNAASGAAQLQEQLRSSPVLRPATAPPPAASPELVVPPPSSMEPNRAAVLDGSSPSPEEKSPDSLWSEAVLSRDRAHLERTRTALAPGSPRGTAEEEAAFFRHKYKPPLLPFVGSGKRIAADLSPVQKIAVSFAFPAFLGRAVVDPKGADTPSWISEHPEMFPPGSRAAYKRDQRTQLLRRYSGDTHEPLPRSRYLALHGQHTTADTYTLLGEMNAYSEFLLSGYCAAVPSADSDSITIVFRGFPSEPNPLWSFVTNPDRYSFFADAWKDPRNEISREVKALISPETEFKVGIPCERVAFELDRVFDLRYPDARAWMLRFFAHPPRTVNDDDLAHGEWLE